MKYTDVEIGGELFPVSFGMNALQGFCRHEGIALHELEMKLGTRMTLGEAMSLIYFGLKDGHRKAGKDFDMTMAQVNDLFDDDFEALERVLAAFSDSTLANQKKRQTKPSRVKAKPVKKSPSTGSKA